MVNDSLFLDLEKSMDKRHLKTYGDIVPKIAEVFQCINPTPFFHCVCWNLSIIDEASFSIFFWMHISRTWRISTVDKKPCAETNQNLLKALKLLTSYCLQWIVDSWCAQQVLKASPATWFTAYLDNKIICHSSKTKHHKVPEDPLSQLCWAH